MTLLNLTPTDPLCNFGLFHVYFTQVKERHRVPNISVSQSMNCISTNTIGHWLKLETPPHDGALYLGKILTKAMCVNEMDLMTHILAIQSVNVYIK